jgi:hypothetical protein
VLLGLAVPVPPVPLPVLDGDGFAPVPEFAADVVALGAGDAVVPLPEEHPAKSTGAAKAGAARARRSRLMTPSYRRGRGPNLGNSCQGRRT